MKTLKTNIGRNVCGIDSTVTYFLKSPATGGYIHLGEGLYSRYCVRRIICAVTAGVGSAIADLLSGYDICNTNFKPIKGIMGLRLESFAIIAVKLP